MGRIFCCDGNTPAVIRIAICQIVLYAALIILHVLGAVFIDDDDSDDTLSNIKIAHRLYIIAACLHLMPLALGMLLLFGVLTKSYDYIRAYIFCKMFETITNTLLFLAGSIYFALSLNLIFGIMLCALPVVIGIFMLECITVVNVFYNTKTKLPEKNQFAAPEQLKV